MRDKRQTMSQTMSQTMNHLHTRPLVRLLLVGLLCAATVVHAARVPFPSEQVSYDLQQQTLKGFLQRFFDDLGLPAVLSAEVQQEPGTLNGPRAGAAAEVFKRIADSNGLVAYYDGSVAYVYKSRELSSRYLQIDPAHAEAFKHATIGFGLTDGNDSLQLNADTGVVAARGTPRFLEQLTQLSTALGRHVQRAQPAPSPPPARMSLRFFPLKYAWAADTEFTAGNQRTVVPGVATILKQLLARPDGSIASVGGGGSDSGALPGLRGKGLAALAGRLTQGAQPFTPTAGAAADTNSPGALLAAASYSQAGASSPSTPAVAGPAASPATAAALLDGSDTPHIVADTYRNAVIIRDSPERMPIYEQLVQQLDVESPIIQLDATVIDIDQTRARQLGVNWERLQGNTSVGFTSAVQPVAGLMVNTIIGNSARFMANVNALEQQGVTNIVQRPQVITLNDVEAVIESTQSLYVPVAGAFDQDLYGIVAGTVLRVTPHIIDDNGHRRIRLLVSVEDGSLQQNGLQQNGQSVRTSTGQNATQAVPLVNRNAVNTQAIIEAGQGLLLGGLVRHVDTRTANQIPVLGSIPLLGRLFRGESVKHQNTERLFLISPQLVRGAGPAMPAPN